MTNERLDRLDALAAARALDKINDIRNSIVGSQQINWSEHIYPLVAALNEAGIEGLPYPESKQNFGTLMEQRDVAVRERDKLREVAEDLYRAVRSEHGHDETHEGIWPSCLPVHIAMNRYRAALRDCAQRADEVAAEYARLKGDSDGG